MKQITFVHFVEVADTPGYCKMVLSETPKEAIQSFYIDYRNNDFPLASRGVYSINKYELSFILESSKRFLVNGRINKDQIDNFVGKSDSYSYDSELNEIVNNISQLVDARKLALDKLTSSKSLYEQSLLLVESDSHSDPRTPIIAQKRMRSAASSMEDCRDYIDTIDSALDAIFS